MAEEKHKDDDVGKAIRARSMEEFEEQTKGKPTPTQEENDRAAMGEHVVDKEPDGSEEQPPQTEPPGQPKKAMAARPEAGGYATRQAQPAPAHSPPRRPTE